MKKIDIVYVNNNILGYFKDSVYQSYNKEEKEQLFIKIENEIKKKDSNRKLVSLIIGLVMLVVAVLTLFLMIFKVISLGESQIFNYTIFIAFLVALWILFYYIFGFIFYSKMQINFSFKSKKTSNPNSALMYASSNYKRWIEQYSEYLKQTNFVIEKKNKKQNELIPFCLYMPSTFKNLIFNGKISSNVPYYYLSISNKRLLFLPSMIILIDGKNSKVINVDDFKVEEKNKTYLLYHKDKLITSFKCEGKFNVNFFYFKYEQL